MKNNPTIITSSGASKKLVPELRFPEFQNDGEWEIVILGDVFERVTDKNKENCQNVVTISAQHGLVSQYDYFNKNVAAANVTNYYAIKKGDFAYNKSRSLGYPYGAIKQLRYYDKGVVSTLYICFRLIDNNGIKDFFDQYFETPLINLELGKLAQEGARNHGLLNISTEDFFDKISLFIPSQIEQQRIAQCLSSLDERIAATKEKVELLKEHKRGLMQKLFPAKGKTLPELRFPEFINEEEWKETSIEEQCPVRISGGTPNTSMTQYYGGDIPFIRSAEIASNKTELTLTQAGIENSSAKIVSKGDILIALYGANSGDVAIAKISGAINQAILCLRPICVNGYLYHFLSQNKSNIIDKYLQGGQGNLSGEIIRSIKFPLPPSKEEQQKISFVLSSIDDMIEQYDEKVKVLKLHKKGLMQKLFPNNI